MSIEAEVVPRVTLADLPLLADRFVCFAGFGQGVSWHHP